MISLAELVEGVSLAAALPAEWAALRVSGLEYDSRRVQAGYLFFAFPGTRIDGRAFAAQAVEKGAVAILSESDAPSDFPAPWIKLIHGRQSLALMARRFYGKPDERIALTGITGTNGKTTTALAIDEMLRHHGKITGLVGTIVYRIGNEVRPAVNTTPESLDLVRLLAELEERGGSHCTLEVSSHALALGRVFGLSFHTAVFSNLTRDHLDFHGTMEEYFEAKQMLFDGAGGPPPKAAVINADDPWTRKLRVSGDTRLMTYGFEEGADLHVKAVDIGFRGIVLDVEHDGRLTRIESKLTGQFNVYNLLAAFGAGLTLGLEPAEAAEGLRDCIAVPGRFERVDEGQPFLVVVDYAHTDDALRNAIETARHLNPKRVITVFGCGGDRDRAKRPLMGETAAKLSDFVIVTSDNPRSEDPLAILNDALVGVRRTETRHLLEPDREAAIKKALEEAGPGDIVLIAGKGHETYQILGDKTIHFDDREVARNLLRSYGYRPKERSS